MPYSLGICLNGTDTMYTVQKYNQSSMYPPQCMLNKFGKHNLLKILCVRTYIFVCITELLNI